jgi:hypothetical protein
MAGQHPRQSILAAWDAVSASAMQEGVTRRSVRVLGILRRAAVATVDLRTVRRVGRDIGSLH